MSSPPVPSHSNLNLQRSLQYYQKGVLQPEACFRIVEQDYTQLIAAINWKEVFPQQDHEFQLLDVGCGSGYRLRRMAEAGWKVEGIDFDQQAVKMARSKGFEVRCGSLVEASYPADTFDVVSMYHVIEHVDNPLNVLRECIRILRPGGRLVLATPNIQSWGHKRFGVAWRGLEPPRHLHLFSSAALNALLASAGFAGTSLRFYIAPSLLEGSLLGTTLSMAAGVSERDRRHAHLRANVLCFFEYCMSLVKPSIADCILACAVKPEHSGSLARILSTEG